MLYLKQSIFSYSPKRYRAKFQAGFYQLYLSLFTLCAVKGFMWFRVLMTKTRGNRNPDMSRKRTVHQWNRPGDHLQMHLYTFLHRKKNVFTPVQRSRPMSAFTRRRHLLFHHWLDTTGLNARVYMYTHTYSTYTVGSTADKLGGRQRDWVNARAVQIVTN